jgi:hypothetical protein
VTVVTGAAWNAVHKKWPSAIHLPCKGPREDDHRSSNSSRHASFNPAEAWLCLQCQQLWNQRNEELENFHLLTLYKSMHGRNKNMVRGEIKCSNKQDFPMAENLEEGGFALVDGIWLDTWLDYIFNPTLDKPR